ncbi:protein ITPRID2 isoform X1 [Oncorhynchus clarkii lewisi]|uniref:protein ITPRID2 isoform X1 n=1 Tax=Oncorhynchus clarkii lewisi TaxID=490388 RepID=UPI0039B92490
MLTTRCNSRPVSVVLETRIETCGASVKPSCLKRITVTQTEGVRKQVQSPPPHLMERPSSTTRRQAWFQTGRQWPTLKEQDPQGPPSTHPSVPHQSASEDDVFSDGCSAGKIESWLLCCGRETDSENSRHNLTVESLLKSKSFEDDLSLGAEATVLDVEEGVSEPSSCPLLFPPPKHPHRGVTTSTPRQRLALPLLHLGHSLASSGLSKSTSKASSVSEALQMCAEDAEETLYQLGFGCDEPEVTARIPIRFINFPSHAHGINLRLFLQSQLHRLRQEDPGLSLASRFRQVEVLTAMANAFYSLYSHVSRTPLQKLAPPEFSFSPTADGQIGRRFMGSVRSEPRSPVERLKDTVSKMCLYTGSGASARLGSDSACPRPGLSPGPGSAPKKRSSLPDLVGLVLENTKAEPLSRDMEEDNQDTGNSNETSAAVDTMVSERETETQGHIDWEGEQGLFSDVQDMDTGDSNKTCAVGTRMFRDRETETPGHRDTVRDKELEQGLSSDGDGVDLERGRHPDRTPNFGASSLSESGHQREPSSRKKLDFGLTTPRPTCEVGETQNTIHPTGWATVVAPVAKVTRDITRPQIVECVHQAPYGSQLQQWNSNTQAEDILSSENVRRSDRSFTTSDGLHKPREKDFLTTSNSAKSLEVAVTPMSKVESSLGETGTLVVSTFVSIELLSCRKSPCLITVTDVTPSSSLDTDAPEMILPASGGTTVVPPAAQYYPGVWRNKRYLSPLKPTPLQGQVSHTIQQANSFELEEVQSAGEEDFGQQETIRSTSLSRSTVNQNKGLVVRGDSMQSDSSGYADDDVDSPDRDKS